MSFPLFDLAKDLAVARSGEDADADSDRRIMRRRIAGIAWAPGGRFWSSSLPRGRTTG